MHDNQPWTAAMVPMLLRELKAKGYKVVHMVAGPGNGPTVAGAGGLVFGDRACDRRSEAAARQVRGQGSAPAPSR